MRIRDKALRELAERFCEEMTITSRARYVATLARRYGASTWRFDSEQEAMPGHYEGTPRQYLWQAFKSGATMPISERRLRSLLTA